tara:strand:+ start:182 stop:346 length:165 start_codon:yes stop_codon:yes gene_type:complete
MIKIIAPIIIFILAVYAIAYHWGKANKIKKKKIAIVLSVILIGLLISTTVLVIK